MNYGKVTSKMEFGIKATRVEPLSDYRIKTWFTDGRVTIYDVKQDIDKIKAFKKLVDVSEFQKVYLSFRGGSIAWGDGDQFSDPDMDVEVPYDEGLIVED